MKDEKRLALRQAWMYPAWIPNCITSLRILGAITLIFLSPLGTAFYVIYAVCGLSDVLDGFLARKLGTASAFGAKLDSAADLSFYAVMLLKLLPRLRKRLPGWIWYWVGLVFCIRMASYLVAAFKHKEFSSRHSYLNKASGVLVFGIGLVLMQEWLTPYCAVVCAVTMLASGEELAGHLLAPPKKQ